MLQRWRFAVTGRCTHKKNSGTCGCLRGKTCGRGCRGPEQRFPYYAPAGSGWKGPGAGSGIAFLVSWRIWGEELVIPLNTCDILNRGLTPLLDIRAAMAYYKSIAPDIWQLSRGKYGRQRSTGIFFLGRRR